MEKNIATVAAIYEAFAQGNVAAVLSKLHPQVEWEYWDGMSAQVAGVPWLAKRKGSNEVLHFFKALSETQFHAFEPGEYLSNDNMVAVTIFMDATFSPSGRRIADEEMHLWKFDADGLVIAFRHYCDTARHIYAADLHDTNY